MAEVRVTIDGLQKLASDIQKNNNDLQTLTSSIERTVTSTVWTGQAADKFKDLWSQQKKNLTDMSNMLDQVKQEVDSRRSRLEAFEA